MTPVKLRKAIGTEGKGRDESEKRKGRDESEIVMLAFTLGFLSTMAF